jgi:hypothetical protein
MSSKRNIFNQIRFLATFVLIISLTVFVPSLPVNAADLTSRSIRLGSSFASETTTHTFRFTTVTPSNVGSIQFQYCSNSPLFSEPCTPVTGLNLVSAGIFTQSGLNGFSVSGATSSSNLIITRAPLADAAPTLTTFVFSNIVNPSIPDSVNYVRISVFDGINGTGTEVDRGAVVFVVEDRFNIDAYVPPYLTFCKAVSVSIDCSTTTGFLVDFGEFSSNSATSVTTQMAAATNDPTGYNIFINGQSMLSGSNIIPALAIPSSSQPGQSQFGINLRANSNPSVGANPEAGAVANGSPTLNYNSPNLFRFVSGENVARSLTSTGFNRYTVSYIVNVSNDQKPGVYATTMSYTAVASF